MAESPKQDYHSSLRSSEESRLREESGMKMGVSGEEGLEKRSEISDCFVLDIDKLTHVAAEKDEVANAKRNMQRTLSRKGYQRGGERKSTERETTDSSSKGALVGICNSEKSINVPLVGTAPVDPATSMITITTTMTNTSENKCKRYNRCSSNVGRRSSWIDPRRVLLAFAALSSMGTMLLIYFTLSISSINGDGAQVRQS